MKINGAYKFRTKAYKDNFRACFLKLSFFEGSTQISKDEFAQSVTGGVIETFIELFTYYYYPLSSFNLSARVQAEILVSDNKGRFLFQRVINNLLDYSFFNVVESVPLDLADNIRHRQLILPDITPILDIENDGFSVSVIIAPQGSYADYMYNGDYRRRISYRNAKISGVDSGDSSSIITMFDIYSFKNNEPIETIPLESELKRFGEINDPFGTRYTAFARGSTLLTSQLYYKGGGLWANDISLVSSLITAAGYSTTYSDNSFIHKYPNTEILPNSGLPAYGTNTLPVGSEVLATTNYNIDFGKSYSQTYDINHTAFYSLGQNYHSVIKDSKTGDIIVLEEYFYSNSIRRPFVDPPVWRLLYNNTPVTEFFDYTYTEDWGGYYLPEKFTYDNSSKIGFFLYNGDFVGMDGFQVREGKFEITIKRNQEYPLLFGDRETTEDSLSVDLPEDFKKALEDSESGDENVLLHQGKEVYSESTKSYWRFCNAVVLQR
jgi:hypothetical protein